MSQFKQVPLFSYISSVLLVYRLSIWAYGLLVRLLAPFYHRAEKFVRYRKDIFSQIESDLEDASGDFIWVHAASSGEFEQGRSIIESIRASKPEIKIFLTFFSPAGYEAHRNNPLVDFVHFLPLDSHQNASKFIEIVHPKLTLFIKYEFWYFYLAELHRRKIPVIMVSSIFRKNQLFFHPAGKFFSKVLKPIDHFFVQDQESAKLLRSIHIEQVTVSGDTRFDRVRKLAESAIDLPIIERFVSSQLVVVLGSVWPSDMKRLHSFISKYRNKYKWIIVPHLIDHQSIESLQIGEPYTKYSEPDRHESSNILLVDKLGLLSSLYRYADFAIIGGGFRGALHNTLEAAAYGVPIFYGKHPNNVKFREVIELTALQVAFPFSSDEELGCLFQNFENQEEQLRLKERAKAFITSKCGATERVMERINEMI